MNDAQKLSVNEAAKTDEQIWQPMIDYATRELQTCLNILETRATHSEDRIALYSIDIITN